ncbi:MAG TPA: TnsD family Tn7-like transposition protein [Blastocatellia bacterium]|nr:TnsD family Tn7-like transposition protein [Blastocatellia bacterium]
MIATFPDLYPDELLYSACARYYARAQFPDKRAVLNELFGGHSAAAVIDLPSHIDSLVQGLPPNHRWTANRLIDGHTFFPLFSAFLPSGRSNQLRMNMRESGGQVIHKRAGIMASRVPLPRRFRFCPLCSEEDEERFGEFYLHRLHQIPGVKVCPLHRAFLENAEPPADYFRRTYEFVPADNCIRLCTARLLNTLDPLHQTLLNIACSAAWLLEQRKLASSLEALHNRYTLLLIDRKLASFSGGVYATELLRAFRERYSSDFLSSLHCRLVEKEGEKDNWLLRLVRNKKNAQHPLRHLLLMDFLECTAEEFFKLPGEIKFFGDPPWPCLNPVADHYQQSVVIDCRLSFRGKDHRPAGTFNCDCGFIYTRTGPDNTPEDRFRISKMKAFGPVWENALKERWTNPSFSVAEIARLQGVDPLTIHRYVQRLGLPPDRQSGNAAPADPISDLKLQDALTYKERKRADFRQMWLSTMAKEPGIEMKRLRKTLLRIYTWLLANDQEWLKSHRPLPSRKTNHNSSSIDWVNRDKDVVSKVETAALQIKNAPERPRRVTISAIGKEIGLSGLLKQKLDKLPRTRKALERVAETLEQFAIRRIWWIAECYQKEGVVPQRWQFVNRSCVYKYASVPGIKETIDAALQSLEIKSILTLAG